MIVESAYNKNGLKLAIKRDSIDSYSVWIRRENYNLGKIIQNWCYIKRDISKVEAEKIFRRRCTTRHNPK